MEERNECISEFEKYSVLDSAGLRNKLEVERNRSKSLESLKDKIEDLKRSIKPLAGDLAQNKQKLSTLGLGFLKDTASLAYYNLKDGSTLNLSIKARGKR